MKGRCSSTMKPLAKITLIAILAYSADTLSKYWVLHHLGRHVLVSVIPNVMQFYLATNPGGSFGISSAYMTYALCLPTILGAAAVAWVAKRQKLGLNINLFEQIGLGLYLGGMAANFADRVMNNGVTDFIHLSLLNFCIFNVADVLIDCGFLLFVIGQIRRMQDKRKDKLTELRATEP